MPCLSENKLLVIDEMYSYVTVYLSPFTKVYAVVPCQMQLTKHNWKVK
jgi:hypothetical protein